MHVRAHPHKHQCGSRLLWLSWEILHVNFVNGLDVCYLLFSDLVQFCQVFTCDIKDATNRARGRLNNFLEF